MVNKRAGIRYQPFEALEGYKSEIKKVIDNRNLISKPVLSDDDYVRINDAINIALTLDEVVSVYVFTSGVIEVVSSKIFKIDMVEGVMVLENNKRIKLLDVIDVCI